MEIEIFCTNLLLSRMSISRTVSMWTQHEMQLFPDASNWERSSRHLMKLFFIILLDAKLFLLRFSRDIFILYRYFTSDDCVYHSEISEMRIRALGEMLTWDLYSDVNPDNWQLLFPGEKIHMWDTTDLPLFGTPSDPILQRHFSSS